MTLLLDTRVFLWWRLDDRRLNAPARRAITAADLVFVSAASAWEAAIKQGLGRLTLTDPFRGMVLASEFEELPVTMAHAEVVGGLPPHHLDPFDRMLVAQAIVERATLVTHDREFEAYGVAAIWT